MSDLTSTSHTTFAAIFVNTKRKRKTRGAAILTKVKKAHEISVALPINFDLRTSKAYGQNYGDFKVYIALQGRNKVIYLIDNWHDTDSDLKYNIQTDIMVFIMNFTICFTNIYNH